MANSPVLFDSLAISSFVRGHHIYKRIWTPSEGEVLQLQLDPSNPKDRFAVVVCLDGEIVGRVPANLAPTYVFTIPSKRMQHHHSNHNWCSGQPWSKFGSGGALLLYTKWTKVLCATCKGTIGHLQLTCLLFKGF